MRWPGGCYAEAYNWCDRLTFKEAGYKVSVIDGSQEMCKQAAALLGQPVRTITFQELEHIDVYDGIWACDTLLHVLDAEMVDVFNPISRALKEKGILYASFKYGDFEGERNEHFAMLPGKFSEFTKLEEFITVDQRPDREKRWLDVVLRKRK